MCGVALGLLRALNSAGLTIGVNWYLIPNESHNDDGCHTAYLNNEQYQACDKQLWSELKRIVGSKQRKISALENGDILQATYYSKLLDFSGKTKAERTNLRSEWHKEATVVLNNTDILFVDSDNGLIVPPPRERSRQANTSSHRSWQTTIHRAQVSFIISIRHGETIRFT